MSDYALWTGAGNYLVAPENTKKRPKLQSVIVSATKKNSYCGAKVYVKYLVTYWVLVSADKTAIIKSTCVETSNQHRAFPSIPWHVKSRSMCVSDYALWTGAGNYLVAPENTKERPKLQSVIVSAAKKF